jgi:hypothetical protein
MRSVVAEEGTLNDLYLEWLYKINFGPVNDRNPTHTYWHLARQLYGKPFVWYIRNDQNRASDGICLRDAFIEQCDIEDVEINWLQEDCSVLEMLAALSLRASFNSMGEPGEWFMKFLDNLQVLNYNDASYSQIVFEEVDLILEQLINRTYDKSGAGGLFPLNDAKHDQTQIELWYQLSAYLLEGEYLDHGP